MLNRYGIKKILVIIIITIIAGIIVGYSYFTFYDYISGPSINILEPQNGSTTATSSILIRGQVLRIKDITLNGKPVLIDEKGNFNEYILLFPGYNVALIQAQDKFKRTIEYKIELVYKK